MSKLRQYIYQTINECPRDPVDLVRAIALFIPDEHPLAKAAAVCLESMNNTPELTHIAILDDFLTALDETFTCQEILSGPWWVKVVCVLITGGSEATEELIESLDSHCISLSALEPSRN